MRRCLPGAVGDPALRQNPLPVPDSIIQIQHSEPGEVPGRGVYLTAQNEVSERVGFGKGVIHPDAIEQCLAGKSGVRLVAQDRACRAEEQDRVVVGVLPAGAGRPLERSGGRVRCDIDAAPVAERSLVAAAVQAAAHP